MYTENKKHFALNNELIKNLINFHKIIIEIERYFSHPQLTEEDKNNKATK